MPTSNLRLGAIYPDGGPDQSMVRMLVSFSLLGVPQAHLSHHSSLSGTTAVLCPSVMPLLASPRQKAPTEYAKYASTEYTTLIGRCNQVSNAAQTRGRNLGGDGGTGGWRDALRRPP